MRATCLARTLMIAGAAGWIATSAVTAQAQQKPAAKTTVYYNQYEPSQRQRLRRETCMRDEVPIGPYCTKKCDKGYIFVAGSKPARCRSVEPLPPGQMPAGIRRQTGVQPPPPGGRQPLLKGNGQG